MSQWEGLLYALPGAIYILLLLGSAVTLLIFIPGYSLYRAIANRQTTFYQDLKRELKNNLREWFSDGRRLSTKQLYVETSVCFTIMVVFGVALFKWYGLYL
jgi:hypothetical protein